MYKIGEFVRTAFCSGHILEVIDTRVADIKRGLNQKATRQEVVRSHWGDRFYLVLDIYRPVYAQGTQHIVKLTEVRF